MARRKNDMGMSLMGGSSSAAEIDSSVDELEDLLQQIEMGLEEMATIGDPGDRQQKVKSLSEKMTRARNVHHSMKVELQDLDDRDKKTYQTKVSAFTPRLSRLQEELKAAKNITNKVDLVHGAMSPMRDEGQMSDMEMMDEAGRIQGKDKQATRRMLKMVANTEEIAANTMETMKNQTDQLARIHQVCC
jgi:predicted  nucleic acid-binding Zn-ribbon protein